MPEHSRRAETGIAAMSVIIRGKDRNGKDVEYSGQGLKARAFCHETDHLNGILFIDRIQEGQE